MAGDEQDNWVSFMPMTRRQALTGLASAAGALVAVSCARSPGVSPSRSSLDLSSGARSLSFDEGWKFQLGAADGTQSSVLDDSKWRLLNLPHDWQIEDLAGGSDDGAATADPAEHVSLTNPSVVDHAPKRIGPFDSVATTGGAATGYTVGGVGWYRKTFEVTGLSAENQVELRFDGVFHRADIWINDQHLGFHPYGFTGFGYDLTPYLREGRNVVAIKVDTHGQPSRWYHGSGIYRHTHLVITGPIRIPRWGVALATTSVGADQSTVKSTVEVENVGADPATVEVRQSLKSADGLVVATLTSMSQLVNGGLSTTFQIEQSVASPALWSIDAPNLYTVVTEILSNGKILDQVSNTFGIRSIVMNGQGFLLNGQLVKMRGANIHHDHGPMGAVGLAASEDRRIQTLRAAGFNAIRSAHNPASPALLDACDRHGMLVYEEAFDTWTQTKTPEDYGNYFADWWQKDVNAWIKNARNHPSVVLYSIGNEIGIGMSTLFTQAVVSLTNAAQGQALASLVKTIDSTRPICQGGAQGIMNFNPLPITGADAYTDVGDIHYNRTYLLKPLVNPEKAWLQSESDEETMYEDWKLVTDNAYAIGDFVWAGWDYIGEAGLGASMIVPAGTPILPQIDPFIALALQAGLNNQPYPYYIAGCGEFDLIGQAKPQLRYRQVIWGDSPLELMVERPVGANMEQKPSAFGWYDELESWTWDLPQGTALRVRAYTAGDQVDLLLNGTKIQSNQLTFLDRMFTIFQVPYTPGELVAIAYKGGKEIGRKTLTTTGAPAALRLTSTVNTLTTDRDALAYVLVEVVDSQGSRVPDSVAKVTFKVSGAGSLVGVANGNPHNIDSFQRPRRYTWHGQALAILRPSKSPGTLLISAEAQGLSSAALTFSVQQQSSQEA